MFLLSHLFYVITRGPAWEVVWDPRPPRLQDPRPTVSHCTAWAMNHTSLCELQTHLSVLAVHRQGRDREVLHAPPGDPSFGRSEITALQLLVFYNIGHLLLDYFKEVASSIHRLIIIVIILMKIYLMERINQLLIFFLI